MFADQIAEQVKLRAYFVLKERVWLLSGSAFRYAGSDASDS
jgi:hypothetical protein